MYMNPHPTLDKTIYHSTTSNPSWSRPHLRRQWHGWIQQKEQIRDELLAPNGIFSVTTCPYVPAHNGVVERLWRTLSDITICQLLASNLPESFWEESAKCANYITNRLPGSHPEVTPSSPYEVYFGIVPPISPFRIFGSICYVKDMLAAKQPRAKESFPGIFVGYE